MSQYFVAIHHPDDYNPAISENAVMHRDIDVLNEEMVAAGIRVFVGGLHPAATAKSIRAQPDGTTRVTDGSYLKTTNTSADSGCWKPPPLRKLWNGAVRPPSRAEPQSKCARST